MFPKTKTRFLAAVLGAAALALLAGCAMDDFARATPTVVVGHPNLSRFHGRAFVLHSISTEYMHHYHYQGWSVLKPRHCLADWIYQKELRYDLDKGWRHEHLGDGLQPPVPVDIVIRLVEASHGIYHGRNMISDIHLPGAVIRTHAMAHPVSVLFPMWTTDRGLIPTNAAEIIYALRILRSGNTKELHHYWGLTGQNWGQGFIGSLTSGLIEGHIYGIDTPMSMDEMRKITNLTSAQLSKMCDAGGGK